MSNQEIRKLPAQSERVETGPVQFGDDWPGVFIRGDNAFALTLGLQNLLGLMKSCDISREQKTEGTQEDANG